MKDQVLEVGQMEDEDKILVINQTNAKLNGIYVRDTPVVSSLEMADKDYTLPNWDDCHDKVVNKVPATALELFIYENEPKSIEDCKKFRAGLSAAIRELME